MLTQRALFLKHIAQTSETPMMLEIKKAKGVYIYDTNDKKYIDLISGIAVSSIGHGNKNVTTAIKKQVNKYMHTMVYGEHIQSPQIDLAKLLCSLLPKKLNSVYYVNSGSEAVEGAIKLAKRFTGRGEIISFKNAYHGSTAGALSLMGNEDFKNSFRPLIPLVKNLEYNNIEQLSYISENTAAVIIEPIQGEAGVKEANINFLIELKKKCIETVLLNETKISDKDLRKSFYITHSIIVFNLVLIGGSFFI